MPLPVMKNMKVKRWFKKEEKGAIDELEKRVCLNCGFEFKGYYCPSCRQSVTEFDKPLGFFFYNFPGNFFSFDFRFFHIFRDLVLKSGFLTVEFFSGKSVKYAPPFRVFILLWPVYSMVMLVALIPVFIDALVFSWFNVPN